MTVHSRAPVGAVLAVALAGGLGGALSCGASSKPPADTGPIESGVDAHADVGAGPEGSTDGGKTGDGAQDAPDGGGPEDITVEVIVLGPDGGGLCDPGTTWGTPTPVLTTAAADSTIFSGVTPDELTVAWVSSVSGVVTAWYADRASTTAAFGAPQALASSFGALAMDRVTVSGDGLRIGGVAADSLSFVGATRPSRSVAFAAADTEFQGLGGGETPVTLATPMLAGDDSELVYLITGQSSDFVMHEANSGLPTWKGGAEVNVQQLGRSGTSYRRPTGLSLDRVTLFYWDETTSSEKIATRPDLTQPFNLFTDIGNLTRAAPTASCQRIYYSMPAPEAGAGAVTIVSADAQGD